MSRRWSVRTPLVATRHAETGAAGHDAEVELKPAQQSASMVKRTRENSAPALFISGRVTVSGRRDGERSDSQLSAADCTLIHRGALITQ